ncbi:MAG: DUF5009 domain-containing protein [Dysgonamonadaceae bacterium]|jgi:predicted acyltransferase|nr:DUF5009 domain-containing protein [Dysgonamonadaceae bacterium]
MNHSSATSARIVSIDAFRAITMLLMVFVNDLWSVKGVPHWMQHAAFNEDMLGLSDVVFPAFLFVLGMSIPFALDGRLKKGESKLRVLGHILIRSVALLIMGLFSVNSGAGLSASVGISKPVFSLVMVTCFFVIWNNYPATVSRSWKSIFKIMRIAAFCVLVFLAVIYRDASGGVFRTRWWGILGLIGWTYLICAIIYLFARKKLPVLIAAYICFILLCMGAANKQLGAFAGILPGNGCFHAFTMGGLLLSLAIHYYKGMNHTKRIFCAAIGGVVSILLGFLVNRWWIISKLQETPTWLFYCTGISVLCYLLLYWLTDLHKQVGWMKVIKPAGTSTLTCYLVPSILYAVFTLTGFHVTGFMAQGAMGLVKCAIFAFFTVFITGVLEKIHIKLKL